MDDDRKRRALGLLRKQSSASMLGDRLPEDQRPVLVITISTSGQEAPAEEESLEIEEEDDEAEELY
jgi:hypothetical protein